MGDVNVTDYITIIIVYYSALKYTADVPDSYKTCTCWYTYLSVCNGAIDEL